MFIKNLIDIILRLSGNFLDMINLVGRFISKIGNSILSEMLADTADTLQEFSRLVNLWYV